MKMPSGVGAILVLATSFAMPSLAADEKSVTAEVNTQTNSPMTNEQLEQRGKQLRQAIDQKYKELVDNKEFTMDNDISDVVIQYVPIGMSFDNAESILHAAGIMVGARPGSSGRGNMPDKYDVRAGIDSYDHEFPCKISLDIYLSPKKPGDYSKISKLSASFFKSCL